MGRYMYTKDMMRSLLLLLTLFFSTSIYSQKSGEEIVRIKKTYYGRNSQNTKKSNTKNATRIYSGEECFDKGLDLLPQQPTKAFEWFQKGANQNDGPCELLCGMSYEGGRAITQNYYKAVEYYQKAANKGIREAMTYLGRCYYDAKGVTRDYQQAYYWFKKGADLGDLNAFSDLGNYFTDNLAVEPNYDLAAKYYEYAAKGEEPRGQYGLAICYLNGEGKPQNAEIALYWMQKAAEKGEAEPMTALGCWYIMDKNGIPVNTIKSLYWMEKAAAAGSELAIKYLPDVREFAKNLRGISNVPISINDLLSFNIVVGSYTTFNNAQTLCQEVREKLGYADVYYDIPTKFYRVICSRNNNLNEVVNQLNSTYLKSSYPYAWILQVVNGKAVEYKN